MDRCVPRLCLEVGSVLAPERALLSDLRYVHLLDVARGVDATGILTMKPDGTRSVVDLERPHHPLLLKMLQASSQSCNLDLYRTRQASVALTCLCKTLRSLHESTVKFFFCRLPHVGSPTSIFTPRSRPTAIPPRQM